MNAASITQFPIAEGAGSVTAAPNLPEGFTDTFTSRLVQAGEVRLHAVIGGQGPAPLLVHGWPENWYAWRHLMPALAKDYTVIALDQRGMGLSDKPAGGYDTGTLADDLVALMDRPSATRSSPSSATTPDSRSPMRSSPTTRSGSRARSSPRSPAPPAPTPPPPFFVPAPLNDKLWHLSFNRVETLPEQLITGREDVFFGYEFEVQGGNLPAEVTDYYIDLLRNPESLRGSLGFYRAFDATLAQNTERATRKLTVPVLGIGGERSYGGHVAENLSAVAEDVQGAVIPGAGHWAAEEAPELVLAALTEFLAPYRAGAVGDAQSATAA